MKYRQFYLNPYNIMYGDNLQIESLEFLSPRGQNDCYLIAALKLLLSCEDFRQSIRSFKPKCSSLPSHYCIVCGTIEIFQQATTKQPIKIDKLKKRLSEINPDSFPEKYPADAMEAIITILNAFHCGFLGDTSEGKNEDLLSQSCKEKCPAHENFALIVEENYTCKCRKT